MSNKIQCKFYLEPELDDYLDACSFYQKKDRSAILADIIKQHGKEHPGFVKDKKQNGTVVPSK